MHSKNNFFSYIKYAFTIFSNPSVPSDFVYFVTSKCNCKCEYCLFKDSINMHNKSDMITLDEVHKIAVNYGGTLTKLSLSGGEPFLRKEIVEICEEFIKNTGTKIIDIPTNGSFPEVIGDKVKRLVTNNPDTIIEIQLSIDGYKELHDEIRKFPGLFDKMLKTYEVLNEIRKENDNLKIKMNVVYQPENKNKIYELFDFMNNNNYVFDRLQLVFLHGEHIKDHIKKNLNYKDFYNASQDILNRYPIFNKKDFHSILFRAIKIERDNVLLKTIKNKNMGMICKAGKRNIVMDDIGNIFPCEPIWKSIGNIRDYDYSIKKICNSDSFNEFKKNYWGKNKCDCTWGNIALDEVIYNPIHYPKILFNYFKLLLNKKEC